MIRYSIITGGHLRSTTDSADCDWGMRVLPEWKVAERERGMMDLGQG